MRAALVQKKHRLADKEKNLKIIEETAEGEDSDLLVFPEMFLTGYKIMDKIRYQAEKIPGPSSTRISNIAANNDTNIICGMPEEVKNDARLRNTALLATSDGELHSYRKSYLANFGPFDEKRYFQPEDRLPVFETPIGKIGVVICYDLFFPELTKSYSQKDVEVIVAISASPSVTRKYFERVLPSRAIETTSFMLYSNLVGREEDMFFWGGATALSPKGNMIGKAEYFEEDILRVEMDLDNIANARSSRPVINDTRENVLSELVESMEK